MRLDTSLGGSERPDFSYERTMTVGANRVMLQFDWWGGEYIEVHALREWWGGKDFVRRSEDGELINVWGVESNKPRIAHTQEAFEDKCEEWLREYGDGNGRPSLMHDILVNWRWDS